MDSAHFTDEWPAPIGGLVAQWRGGGELWMSGPEWGWLKITGIEEMKGVLPEVLWSTDGHFIAFVKLHIEDVPTRQGVEGIGYRVAIVRMADKKVRHCFGNSKLSSIKLKAFNSEFLDVLVGDKIKRLPLKSIDWESQK